MTSIPDPRAAVRQAVTAYLEDHAPERREELAAIFDAVYERLGDRSADYDAADEGRFGLPIDPAFLEGSLLTSLVWVASRLLEALARRVESGDGNLYRSARRSLADHFDPALVDDVAHRLERQVAAPAAAAPAQRSEGGAGVPEVGSGDAGTGFAAPPVEPAPRSVAPGLPPSEVEIFVDRHAAPGGTELRFRLTAHALGMDQHDVGRVSLDGSPFEYLRGLFSDLETLTPGDGADPQGSELSLRAFGADQFKKLLPSELRESLWQLCDGDRTLQIVSDDAWIPWELIKIHGRRGNPHADGPFLADAFLLSRWLRGRPAVPRLSLARWGVVRPPGTDLRRAGEEEREILAFDAAGRQVRRAPTRLGPLLEALSRNGLDVLHFIGHGKALNENAARSYVELEEAARLTPRHLSADARHFGDAHPLVFLNACQSGRTGPGLTGLAGWAPTLLEIGAGAFLAPLWSIGDGRATLFALSFYRLLLAGQPIAAAVRGARRALAEAYPGDPVRYAYCLYAHPLTRG